MNTKAKGNAAEREVWHLMKSWGFEAVCSKASLGAADIVAWNNDEIRFIQSKNESNPRSYGEDIERLKKMKCPPNGKRELWIRHRGGGWTRKNILSDGTIIQDEIL